MCIRDRLKALDAAIREKKELQTQVLAYAKTTPARVAPEQIVDEISGSLISALLHL